MRLFFTSLFLMLSLDFCKAEDDPIFLTSLDWLPYTGVDLKDGGPITDVVRKAFLASGYKVKVMFYPWKRATNSVKNLERYAAYFPGYKSKSAERDFLISQPFGDSPLGLMARSDSSFTQDDFNDLTKYRVGVVAGYNNTADFDANVRAGNQKTEVSPDDATLIKKVAEGRVKLALIDKHVLHHLLANDPKLSAYKDKVVFVKTLENKKLHVCFKRTSRGEALLAAFNKGLDILKGDADEIQVSFDATVKIDQKS